MNIIYWKRLGLSRIVTVTPHGLLMLRNCLIDFAVVHWFGCRATEPGFAGDIGAIEVWLIDWLIDYTWHGCSPDLRKGLASCSDG